MTYRLIEIEPESIFVRVASALCSVVDSFEVAWKIVGRLNLGSVLGRWVPEILDGRLPVVVGSDRIEKGYGGRLVERHAGDAVVGYLGWDLCGTMSDSLR